MAARSSGRGWAGTGASSRSSARAFDTERRWQLLEDGLTLIRELWAGPLGPREIPIWIGGNSGRARRLAAAYDGWLPDSTTPFEMSMSPDDVRDEAIADTCVMGYSDAGQHDLHDAYADAGATWWLESLHDHRSPYEQLLARVSAGP